MHALVIGYGSIGSRHSRLLQEMGCRTAVVSSRENSSVKSYRSLSSAVQLEQPDYIVIANRTNQHCEVFHELIHLGFDGIVLVEKPIFHIPIEIPPYPFKNAFAAYNLRFHPVITRLREILATEKVISVQAYVGQYLPSWRPLTDYRLSYSSDALQGGGVLRDLSHELDYLNWMFGGWVRLAALGGRYSHLEITSDDVYSILMETKKCPVTTVQMNYLDRMIHRRMIINTDTSTIEADLIRSTIRINEHVEELETDRDFTYRAMHAAALEGECESLCSLKEGLDVVEMIREVEKSAQNKVWVAR